MTETENLGALIKSSKGAITTEYADNHDIHREYLNEYVGKDKLNGLLTVSMSQHRQLEIREMLEALLNRVLFFLRE